MTPTRLLRLAPAAVLVAAAAVLFLAVPPWPQNPSYHAFADQRPLLGVPHMQNVLSNVPFLAVGGLALGFLRSEAARKAFRARVEIWPFALFFAGIFATGFGSAWYHLDPTSERLVWDRLPIAFAFMALFAGVIGERVSLRLGLILLGPLVLLGVGSVVLWHLTDDLRLYLLVQGYPMVAIPLLLVAYPPTYTGTADYVVAVLWYVGAKEMEVGDHHIYNMLGGATSGHTIKHLLSAVGAWWVLRMLRSRRPV